MSQTLTERLHEMVQARRFQEVHELCENDLQLLNLTTDKAKTLFRRAENFLQAYYLAGYAQAVLRQWDLAMRYFQYTIVVIPATAPSALAIESQKKFILCSLIRYGHLRAHPVGLVPKCLTRAFQQNLAVYYELSHLYSAVISSALPSVSFPTTSLYSGESTTANTDRRAALQRFVEQNQAIFEQDEHFGLVRQALDQIPRHIIQLTLPRVYCRLTVGEIGQLTQSPSVEATTELLNEMIHRNEISAVMEGSILSFIDPSATTTTTTTTTEQVNNFPPAIEQKLKQTAEKTAALVEQLRQLDQHLSESSRYKKNLTSGRVAMAIDAEERMAEMMAEYGEISSNDVTMLFE